LDILPGVTSQQDQTCKYVFYERWHQMPFSVSFLEFCGKSQAAMEEDPENQPVDAAVPASADNRSDSSDSIDKEKLKKTRFTERTMHETTTMDYVDEDRDFDIEKYPVREWEFRITGFKDNVAFNPLVSLIGVTLLWGLAIWSMGKLVC